MKIQFKLASEHELYTIEGENLTLIKVALIERSGELAAYHIFQKKLEDSILLFCPTRRDLQNLVKGDYANYVSTNRVEITEAINSIKEK